MALQRRLTGGASAASERSFQKRASWFDPPSAIQKLIPSLQTPYGVLFAGSGKDPSRARSAALQSWMLSPLEPVTRMRSPSNAALKGEKPSPRVVKVWTTVQVAADTTTTSPSVGTQMFVPSKAGRSPKSLSCTVWITFPAASNFVKNGLLPSVIQMLFPSNTTPRGFTTLV